MKFVLKNNCIGIYAQLFKSMQKKIKYVQLQVYIVPTNLADISIHNYYLIVYQCYI